MGKIREILIRGQYTRKVKIDEALEDSLTELKEVNVAMQRRALQLALQARAVEHDHRELKKGEENGA